MPESEPESRYLGESFAEFLAAMEYLAEKPKYVIALDLGCAQLTYTNWLKGTVPSEHFQGVIGDTFNLTQDEIEQLGEGSVALATEMRQSQEEALSDTSHHAPEKSRLGNYLKNFREFSGKTLREVGGTALASGYMSQVENGTISDVKVSKLIELSKAYGLPIASILRDVYDYGASGEEPLNSRALAIGEAVLSLPEGRQELTIEWIQYQAHASRE